MTQGWKKAVSVMLCAAMILSMSSVMISADELNQPTTGVEQTQPENENTNETPEENKENTDNNTTEGETPNTENEQTSEAVKNVIAQLEALPKLDDLTEGTDTEALKNQVESAKAAFDTLTEEEKASISEELKGNLVDLDIFVTNFIVNTPTAIPETENDKVVGDQDGIVTLELTEDEIVAKVGDQAYDNLQDAIDNANGQTVVLQKNVDISNSGLKVTGTATLDLNGKEIKAASTEAGNIQVTGNFTLKDTAGQGKIYTETDYTGSLTGYTVVDVNGGTFTMESGLIEAVRPDSENKGQFGVGVGEGGTVNIKGGTIKAGWYAVSGNGNDLNKNNVINISGGTLISAVDYAVYHPQAGTLNISGGLIDGGKGGVSMNRGTLNVTGGTIQNQGTGNTGNWGDGTGGMVGSAINIGANYDEVTANITGGTFISNSPDTDAVVVDKGAQHKYTANISNAEIKGNVNLTNSVEGSSLTLNNTKVEGDVTAVTNSTVVIENGSNVSGEVKGDTANVTITDSTVAGQSVTNSKPFEVDGDKKYATLAEAIQKVKDGGTIKLLADIPNAVGVSVPSGKNFTLDFNGKTYTLKGPGAGSSGTETNGFQLLKDSNITFRNGTIRVAEKPDNIKFIIQNYSNLTLENMQIYAENKLETSPNYILSFNNGDITFKGNTSIYTNNPEDIAFDVCNFSNYPQAKVTFDSNYTGTIQGVILFDSPNANTHKLIIQGNGTFGRVDATTGNEEAAKNAIQIFGGSFAESVEEYVIDYLNYELHSYDGRYTYYHTLEEAKDAAQGVGGVITDVDTGNVVVTVKPDDSKPSKPSKPSNGGSSNSGSSNSGSSNSGTTVDKEEEDYNEFWDKVIDRINKADEGDTITVHAGNYDKMPNKVMKALEKNGVGLIIKYNGGEIEIPAGEAVNKSNKLFWSFKELGNYVFATEDNDEQNNDKQDNEQNNGSENNTQSNTQTEQKPFGTVETKPNPQTGSEDYVGLAAALAVTAGVAAIGLGKKKKDEE